MLQECPAQRGEQCARGDGVRADHVLGWCVRTAEIDELQQQIDETWLCSVYQLRTRCGLALGLVVKWFERVLFIASVLQLDIAMLP